MSGPRREDVRIGDVIEVPQGFEHRGSARYRMRVVSMSSSGIGGVKVKIDGSTMRNRHDEPIESSVSWHQLPEVILHKEDRT